MTNLLRLNSRCSRATLTLSQRFHLLSRIKCLRRLAKRCVWAHGCNKRLMPDIVDPATIDISYYTEQTMTKKQQPHWQPIEKLSLIAYIIDGTLASANETHKTLQQAQRKPYSLDDATVNRAIKLYTDQKNGLWEFDEQLRRWTTQQ